MVYDVISCFILDSTVDSNGRFGRTSELGDVYSVRPIESDLIRKFTIWSRSCDPRVDVSTAT